MNGSLFSDDYTILFKIITRIRLLFPNYLGGYSYSFRGFFELFTLQLQFPCSSNRMQLQEIKSLGNYQ